MDQEFYFEETNSKKSFIISVLIILIILVFCLYLFVIKGRYTLNLNKNLKFEVGSKVNYDIKTYVNNNIIDENDYFLFLNSLPIENDIFIKTGVYDFTVKYKNVSKKGKIEIIDTVSPKVEVIDLTIGLNEKFNGEDFLSLCDDYSKPCKVDFKHVEDKDKNKIEGTHKINLIVSDDYDNKTEVSANLIVKKGYNSIDNKEKDLKIDHINPEFSDFNGTLIVKYNKGYDSNEIDESDAYHDLMEITGSDFHEYLDPLYTNNLIVDSQIIEVYNKYDLIIGYAIRVKLDNGLYFYLSK